MKVWEKCNEVKGTNATIDEIARWAYDNRICPLDFDVALEIDLGCYLVVGFDRHWFYDIAEYFPIDNEWVMNENQSDSTYLRYWMPLPEPSKEDA